MNTLNWFFHLHKTQKVLKKMCEAYEVIASKTLKYEQIKRKIY